MSRYLYSGDINLEEGGYFFTAGKEEKQYGYSSVVRIQPCSDAGGPDNCWWVETLMVNIPDDKHLAMALDFCGYHADWLKGLTAHQRFCRIVDACVAAGHYDPDDLFSMALPACQIVQIGPDDPYFEQRHPNADKFEANVQLRANWKLRNWIKATYLKG